MCAQSAGVRCLCKKEAHVGVAQTCVCTYVCAWLCVCGCRCLSVCVCVQVTQSLAKARTTVNKHAEIENGQRNALGLNTPPLLLSAPLPAVTLAQFLRCRTTLALVNAAHCLPANAFVLSSVLHAYQSRTLSLSLSVMLSLSLFPCLSVFVCVRVACSQALISTTAKRLSFDLTVTSLPASARLCFIQLPTACKCNFN